MDNIVRLFRRRKNHYAHIPMSSLVMEALATYDHLPRPAQRRCMSMYLTAMGVSEALVKETVDSFYPEVQNA